MAEPLKNIFFTETTIHKLADEITRVYAEFDKGLFLKKIYVKEWNEKELKERMYHVSVCLRETLPDDYTKALIILHKIAPLIRGFDGMCLPNFVEKYGQDSWDESLNALMEFTKYSSSEFAVRPFIKLDQEKAMKYMLGLSSNDNEHVRRFSSEGCRPRLPWAMALPALKKDPTLFIPILENLKADESEYVRKSVANNLNDISKDHPELVLDICKKWQGASKHTDWIIKRACRGLLKAGHPKAMVLFGYSAANGININKLTLANSILKIGGDLSFSFEFENKSKTSTKVRLEYIVDYVKSGGKLSGKVFMIAEKEFDAGKHSITKKHSFKERTIRKHYPGEHCLRIIINGVEKVSETFMLANE